MLPLIAIWLTQKFVATPPVRQNLRRFDLLEYFFYSFSGTSSCSAGGNCPGWSCRVSDAGCGTVPASDARLSTWRRLYVHVDGVHRRVLDRLSHTDNRLTGTCNTSLFAGTAYHV